MIIKVVKKCQRNICKVAGRKKRQNNKKQQKKNLQRVPFEQTSIKNIVEDADIARGSFYQYFESKEDLLRVYFKYTF